jgi:hypothetical protein
MFSEMRLSRKFAKVWIFYHKVNMATERLGG